MPVEVKVTATLRRLVNGQKSIFSQGTTVAEVLDHLEAAYPGFKRQVTGEDGQMHRFVNIYLNDEDIRFLERLDTRLRDGDVLSILPALAGGC